MPTNDKEVQAALASFGAVLKKTSNDANVAVRADLLAGLALLHTITTTSHRWSRC